MSVLINQRYEVLQQLGNGNFAQTYLVKNIRNPEQGRAVLKLLKPKHLDRRFATLAKTLFEQEVQILKSLGRCGSIPSLLAEFDENGETGLVQTFIEGISVQDAFRQNLFWDEAQLVNFLKATLSTLELLHNAGFVHRDLNPAHWIQPFEDKSLMLIDFDSAQKATALEAQGLENCGLEDKLNGDPDLATAFVIGTNGYMAPEQMQGDVDCRADLYALGLIAIQGVTGRSPLQLSRNIQGEVRWQPLRPIHIELIDILTHLVRYRAQDRYSSAAEALRDVNEYAQPRWSHRLTKWWEPKRSPLHPLAS
jgi:serine/threonine-protein kinase